MKRWQGDKGGGVENESVVGLSSFVGFFRKSPKSSVNMGKCMEIKCSCYPSFPSYISQITSLDSLSSLYLHWDFRSVEQNPTFFACKWRADSCLSGLCSVQQSHFNTNIKLAYFSCGMLQVWERKMRRNVLFLIKSTTDMLCDPWNAIVVKNKVRVSESDFILELFLHHLLNVATGGHTDKTHVKMD